MRFLDNQLVSTRDGGFLNFSQLLRFEGVEHMFHHHRESMRCLDDSRRPFDRLIDEKSGRVWVDNRGGRYDEKFFRCVDPTKEERDWLDFEIPGDPEAIALYGNRLACWWRLEEFLQVYELLEPDPSDRRKRHRLALLEQYRLEHQTDSWQRGRFRASLLMVGKEIVLTLDEQILRPNRLKKLETVAVDWNPSWHSHREVHSLCAVKKGVSKGFYGQRDYRVVVKRHDAESWQTLHHPTRKVPGDPEYRVRNLKVVYDQNGDEHVMVLVSNRDGSPPAWHALYVLKWDGEKPRWRRVYKGKPEILDYTIAGDKLVLATLDGLCKKPAPKF